MFSKKKGKPKKSGAVECPFCGSEVESVSYHIEFECAQKKGAASPQVARASSPNPAQRRDKNQPASKGLAPPPASPATTQRSAPSVVQGAASAPAVASPSPLSSSPSVGSSVNDSTETKLGQNSDIDPYNPNAFLFTNAMVKNVRAKSPPPTPPAKDKSVGGIGRSGGVASTPNLATASMSSHVTSSTPPPRSVVSPPKQRPGQDGGDGAPVQVLPIVSMSDLPRKVPPVVSPRKNVPDASSSGPSVSGSIKAPPKHPQNAKKPPPTPPSTVSKPAPTTTSKPTPPSGAKPTPPFAAKPALPSSLASADKNKSSLSSSNAESSSLPPAPPQSSKPNLKEKLKNIKQSPPSHSDSYSVTTTPSCPTTTVPEEKEKEKEKKKEEEEEQDKSKRDEDLNEDGPPPPLPTVGPPSLKPSTNTKHLKSKRNAISLETMLEDADSSDSEELVAMQIIGDSDEFNEWEAVYDNEFDAYYYWNTITHEVQWEPPEGWGYTNDEKGSASAPSPSSSPSKADSSSISSSSISSSSPTGSSPSFIAKKGNDANITPPKEKEKEKENATEKEKESTETAPTVAVPVPPQRRFPSKLAPTSPVASANESFASAPISSLPSPRGSKKEGSDDDDDKQLEARARAISTLAAKKPLAPPPRSAQKKIAKAPRSQNLAAQVPREYRTKSPANQGLVTRTVDISDVSSPSARRRKPKPKGVMATMRFPGKKKKNHDFTITRTDDDSSDSAITHEGSEDTNSSDSISATQGMSTDSIGITGGEEGSVLESSLMASETGSVGSEAEELEIKDSRTKVANEILKTERYYNQVLSTIISKYQTPLLAVPPGQLSSKQVQGLFGNISYIQPLNKELLENLEERLSNWSSETSVIGDIFLTMAPFLKMYNQYGNNYDTALEQLRLFRKDAGFVEALEQCEGSTGMSQDLEALLIAPIQRIPRYILLLQELLKSTDATHPDHSLLEKCIPMLKEVGDYINREIHESANLKKLLDLSAQGAGTLLKASRTLVFEGAVEDQSRGRKKMHAWLFNDLFVALTEAKAKNKANLTKEEYQWPLHLVWIYDRDADANIKKKKKGKENQREDALCFEIIGPNDQYTMRSATVEDKRKWFDLISKQIATHMEYLSRTQDSELDAEKAAGMTADDPKRNGYFNFPNGQSFRGWWLSGKFDGSGHHRYNGFEYTGEFYSNLKHGKGVLRFPTGEVYEGEFKDDLPHGKGVLTDPSGDIYSGEFANGRRHGKGSLKFKNGDSLDGDFADDFPHGMGEWIFKSGIKYTGNFQYGLRSHYGILVGLNGNKYEGNWENGFRHGTGRQEYGDGRFYDGVWKEGQMHGKGKMAWPNEGTYEGDWVNDQREGKGRMEYKNGCIYEGDWKRSLFHGTGKVTYGKGKNGGIVKSYSGEWNNGKRHGKGVLKLRNKNVYEGHFRDNLFHGSGVFIVRTNMFRFDGSWKKGKPDGKFNVFLMDEKSKKKREVYSGAYRDGQLHNSDSNVPPIPFMQWFIADLDDFL